MVISVLQVNIKGLKYKLEALKLLIHDTHADIIKIQETKLTPKVKTPKVHNFTTLRTDRLHKAGDGLITLIRDNITFTTDIPSTINTHNTELQMVKLHINNTKHIAIANIYIPPRDSTSTQYKTADTDIQHITNVPHSVLTGDVNAKKFLSLLCMYIFVNYILPPPQVYFGRETTFYVFSLYSVFGRESAPEEESFSRVSHFFILLHYKLADNIAHAFLVK